MNEEMRIPEAKTTDSPPATLPERTTAPQTKEETTENKKILILEREIKIISAEQERMRVEIGKIKKANEPAKKAVGETAIITQKEEPPAQKETEIEEETPAKQLKKLDMKRKKQKKGRDEISAETTLPSL
jgi:predicted  nucleic acid-binding Zn-ribbon protein